MGAITDTIDSSIEEEGIDFEEGEEREELKHLGHEHNLILSRNQVEVHHNKLCEGCMQLIFAPFYSCEQCNYFLHSACARLPLKKRLPTHPHVLTLYPCGSQIGNTEHCFACQRRSHGFTYKCSDCEYSIDIRCCSIPKTFKHEGHQHPLFLAPSSVQKCNSCEGQRSANGVFVCTKCNFGLGFECATLPLKVEYEYHPHPLSLTYIIENDSEEYYCLICEEERNPNHWVYCCVKCNFTAHLRCVVGRYPYIKYGIDFTWKNHQHPLNFVRRTKDSRPCDECGKFFDDDLALNCRQCKFIIHPWYTCMGKMST
ncbi:protein VACUOLELESS GAMETOPHYTES-like isoform X1 [Corylus avellana]|uniref:protein VACUOLELESS GAMETOPHYTES-like isoform X1 n=1 Tax=Corylus avellana TaxID=13451 RepID=UPI00286AA4AC|nr:protein VACUOLELESS GAMETOPHYTES-like isoform X1 [Corylus avellana]